MSGPIQNENGAVLFRIWLSATLQRRKRSLKTEPFKNALQSGANWKRCFLKTLIFSGENDAIWKRWHHQNRHDRALDHSTVSIQNGGQTLPYGFNFAPISRTDILRMRRVHLSMRTEGIKAFSKRIRRCGVNGRKRVWTQIFLKTEQKSSVFD